MIPQRPLRGEADKGPLRDLSRRPAQPGVFVLFFDLPLVAVLFLPLVWGGAGLTAIEDAGGIFSRSPARTPVLTVVQWIALVALAPVVYATTFIWNGLLGHSTNPFLEAQAGGPVVTIIVLLWIVFVTWRFWWVIVVNSSFTPRR